MTTTAPRTQQSPAARLGLWTALRNRIQDGAQQRQLRRELSPFSSPMAGVAPGDSGVAREIRAMMLNDYERI